MYASLYSIGSYIPKNILSNKDLEKMVDTSDEWITKRTGIKERRIADKEQCSSDLGYLAALNAIKNADIDKNTIDCVICATLSPDYLTMPSTASQICTKLGLKDIMAFDISAACSGFVYLLDIAKSLIESGSKKNVLIVGAEKASSVMNYSDRSICILFGDGAGAGLVCATNDKNLAIIDVHASCDGSYADLLITKGGGSKFPIREDNVNDGLQYMTMRGNEVFKVAVNTLSNDVINILKKNNMDASDVDFFVPHQANKRIIDAVKNKLNFPASKTAYTVQDFGNTSSASIPMAMDRYYKEGRIKKGDLLLLDTFGGGFTWGSALLRFGAKPYEN